MTYQTLKSEVPVTKADVRQLQNTVQEILSAVQEDGDEALLARHPRTQRLEAITGEALYCPAAPNRSW